MTNETETNKPVVYLMRGLPSCGKSTKSKQLAGANGVICETDEYFYTEVGDDRKSYDYDASLIDVARNWNYDRFSRAVQDGVGFIVVDRGNGLNVESQRYALFAVEHGYRVELTEPDSEWWQEIKVLLRYKEETATILDRWAERLAKMNRQTHRTPAKTIRRWMSKWRSDLSVEQILRFQEPKG